MPTHKERLKSGNAPVTLIEPDKKESGPRSGIALCLSGGGYRAMLFHLGTLLRLNEIGLLRKLNRISSVSGGSITAGLLGLKWTSLNWNNQGVASNFEIEIMRPIRALAGITIDVGSVVRGAAMPGTISERIVRAYEKHLFGIATLQALPSDDQGPRFVINATNVQSGALWRFSKPFMADYLVGMVKDPTIRLSVAVAASSAFPPVLSPTKLRLRHTDFLTDRNCPLQKPPFTTDIVLTDGGVYDNLGLETAWKRFKTILVSDAGGKMGAEGRPRSNWGHHSFRVLNIIDNQVRSLRKRQLIAAYQDPRDVHDGAYWGIRTNINHYKVPHALPCPHIDTLVIADTPTRLSRLSGKKQDQLINWGYAACDAAIRKHVDSSIAAPIGFPYPRAKV